MNKEQLEICKNVINSYNLQCLVDLKDAIKELEKEIKEIETKQSINEEETLPEDFMFFDHSLSERKSFRCEVCKANVFRKLKSNLNKAKCNGCGEIYRIG